MQRIVSFLERNGLHAGGVDPDSLLAHFAGEMARGLAGESSSLAMIPTYIGVDNAIPAGEPVVVIDAGGTNLRVAVVVFDAHGNAEIGDYARYPMPGIARELSRAEFFDQLLEYVSPLAGRADRIGFCFSYATEISPQRDGKLLYWTKEIKAPEVIGRFVGADLRACLGRHGHTPRITVLNDTVATLLAGRSIGRDRQYESYVGVILGTGTNTAYVEQNANITRCNGLDPAGRQAINIESGNFARCPQTEIDAAFDATTATPGKQRLEKMVSGAYLGGLALAVLRRAAKEGLLSPAGSAAIAGAPTLTPKEMDRFLDNPFAEGPVNALLPELNDKRAACAVFTALVSRASLLAAVNISATVIKSGAGHDPLHPVAVNIDGSTYYKTRGMQSMAEGHLRALLGSRGIHYRLLHVDEAPLIGAAVAGLS